jgi:AmmeMemoRadiSam system protein A
MPSLDEQTRGRLLRTARAAIEEALFGVRLNESERPWPSMEPRGAFVTLWRKESLRGCVGTFEPHGDLPATIRSMAVAAANDPRFACLPISENELKGIHIEISVLSPLERIGDPLNFELGRHGIYVKRGGHAGCFLPDVAKEEGWDKETFLSQCCRHKAGMAPAAWKQPGTEIFVFTVEKFSEVE